MGANMALAWENVSDVARSPRLIKQHASDRVWQVYGPLAEAKARAQPFVITQLGQSLDGRIAAPSGHSHYINGGEALEHLHRLRAQVDAVVVGASTADLDNPSLTVRRVAGDNPARVVIDPNRRVNVGSTVFTNDGARVIVIGPTSENDPDHISNIAPDANGAYPPAWIISQLAEAGLQRLLIEGGATTVSQFIAAKVVDRLHILTGPLIIGSGPTGLALPAIDHLRDALRPETSVYPFSGGDVLFDCRFDREGAGTI